MCAYFDKMACFQWNFVAAERSSHVTCYSLYRWRSISTQYLMVCGENVFNQIFKDFGGEIGKLWGCDRDLIFHRNSRLTKFRCQKIMEFWSFLYFLIFHLGWKKTICKLAWSAHLPKGVDSCYGSILDE